MAILPADMTSCSSKQICLTGPNKGLAYDPAEPCAGNATFDPVACDCLADGCWEITRTRDCYNYNDTTTVLWYKPANGFDENGNIIFYQFFRSYNSVCSTAFFREPCSEEAGQTYDQGDYSIVTLDQICINNPNYTAPTIGSFGIWPSNGGQPTGNFLTIISLGECQAYCGGQKTATVQIGLRYLGPGDCSLYQP